jgi:hypothetical protein
MTLNMKKLLKNVEKMMLRKQKHAFIVVNAKQCKIKLEYSTFKESA